MVATLFLIKLFVAITVVLGLSIVSERVSPRVAGILSGYPTGSAITLLFFGLEMSPEFAAQSALFNMAGLTAMLGFIYVYYLVSRRVEWKCLPLSSAAALTAYFISVLILHRVNLTLTTAVLIPLLSTTLAVWLLKGVKNVTVEQKIKLSFSVLFVRAIAAASIILIITGIPRLVGPAWAGLFSAFPTTLFPLILIVHRTYGKTQAHTVIKNVPLGIYSLILYSLTVSFAYPRFGVFIGTLISFGAASVYLLLYWTVKTVWRRCAAAK